MRQLRLLLSVVLIVALVSSSNTPSESTIENNGLNPNFVETITYGMPYDFTEYSFYTKNSYATYQWTSAIEASLVKRSGSNNSWVPDLITSMPTISPDHLTYNFTLKGNLYFSTGHPLTIQDVNFSLFVAIDSKINIANSYLYSGYLDYNSFTPISANTFSLTLLQPYSMSMDIFSFPIVPQGIFNSRYESCMYGVAADCTWNAPDGSDAVSAGPFMVDYIDTINNVVTLAANPLYYNAGSVKTDALIFKKIATKSDAISDLGTGLIDILDAQYVPNIGDFAGLTNISEAFPTSLAHQELALNHKHPYFGTGFSIPGNEALNPLKLADQKTAQNDAKLVRHAMSLAMNRSQYADIDMGGLAQAAATIVNPLNAGYDPAIMPDPYNITLARALMSGAGFNYTNIGLPDGNGFYSSFFFNITILTPNTYIPRNNWSADFAEQLLRIGIGVTKVDSTGWATIIPRTFGATSDPALYDAGGYDVLFVGYSDPMDFSPYDLFTSAGSCSTGDCANFYNFDLSETLSPIANISRRIDNEYNQTVKLQYIRDFQQAFSDWLPSIQIIYPKSHWGYRDDLVGIQPSLLSTTSQEWDLLYRKGFTNNPAITTPISTSTYTSTTTTSTYIPPVSTSTTYTVTAYPPVVNGPSEMTVFSDTTGNTLLWTVYSSNPSYFEVYVNGVYFTNGTYINGGTIGLGLDNWELGNYTVVVSVYDTYGQFTSLTTVVHVVMSNISPIPTNTTSIRTITPLPSPPTNTSEVNPPPNDESSTGPGLPVPFNAYLMAISLVFIGIVRYKFNK